MKCIICDKCKKTIEDPRLVRTVTCSRPLPHRHEEDEPCRGRGDDPRMNDIIWEKDLCQECAAQVEELIDSGE